MSVTNHLSWTKRSGTPQWSTIWRLALLFHLSMTHVMRLLEIILLELYTYWQANTRAKSHPFQVNSPVLHPKTNIYNLQPNFVRSSQENSASMSVSEKSCTLLHHGSGASCQHWSPLIPCPFLSNLDFHWKSRASLHVACNNYQLLDISIPTSFQLVFPISSTFKPKKKRCCFRFFPGFNIS